MSGGVDSAVAALLCAHEDGADAVAVTLELWRDRRERRRALVLLGEAVRGARALAHRMGLAAPHARPARRVPRRRRRAVARRPRRGPDAEPVRALQRPRPPRRDARARRRASARRRSPPATTRASTTTACCARAADPAKDQSYMLAALAPATLARLRFPLGELTQARGARARRARGRPAGRAQARLAGPLLPRRHRPRGASSPATAACATGPGEIVDRAGPDVSAATAATTLHGRPAPRPRRRRRRRAALRARRPTPRANTVTVGPRAELRDDARARCATLRCTAPPGGSTRVKLRYRAARRSRVPRCDGDALELDEPVDGAAPGQTACLLRGRRRRRLCDDRRDELGPRTRSARPSWRSSSERGHRRLPVGVARARDVRPVGAAHDGGHAPAQALLPGPREAAAHTA